MFRVEKELHDFDLGEWWLATFSQDERHYIELTHLEQFYLGSGELSMLSKEEIEHFAQRFAEEYEREYSSEGATDLLRLLAEELKPQDRAIARRILEKAKELATQGNILDLHFSCHEMITSAYRARNVDPVALEEAIEACEKQIAIAPKAAAEFRRLEYFKMLPEHTGYKQLSIIREKQENYAEAIRLASQAKEQGWNGDWDKRIERCEAKLQKQGKS